MFKKNKHKEIISYENEREIIKDIINELQTRIDRTIKYINYERRNEKTSGTYLYGRSVLNNITELLETGKIDMYIEFYKGE